MLLPSIPRPAGAPSLNLRHGQWRGGSPRGHQLLAPSLKYRKTQKTNSAGKIPFAAGSFSPPPLPLVQSSSSFMAFPTTATPTRPFSTLWPITQSNPLPTTSADGAVPSRNPRSGGSRALPRLFSMTSHQSCGPCCHHQSPCF